MAGRKAWAMGRDSRGGAPVIGTILLVGITVVLAATLYIMAFGIGIGQTNTPPVATVTKDAFGTGVKFTFTPVSRDTVCGDVSIVLADGTNTISFENISTESMASGGGTVTKSFGSRALGTIDIFLNITDLTGNGYVNGGDYFTFLTSGGNFSNTVTYTLYVMHNPTAAVICSQNFQGS